MSREGLWVNAGSESLMEIIVFTISILSLLDALEMVLPWHPIHEGGMWLGARTKEGKKGKREGGREGVKEGGREGSLYERVRRMKRTRRRGTGRTAGRGRWEGPRLA
jgi:hypothetical protein